MTRPDQLTSWNCARATVTMDGLKCPAEGHCRDCPVAPRAPQGQRLEHTAECGFGDLPGQPCDCKGQPVKSRRDPFRCPHGVFYYTTCDACNAPPAIQGQAAPVVRPASIDVALSMCREANAEVRLPTPMCWDLARYVEKLEAGIGAPAAPDTARNPTPEEDRFLTSAVRGASKLVAAGQLSSHPAAGDRTVPTAAPLSEPCAIQGSAPPVSPMVVKAAREMVRIHAEACNVDKDDLWAIEGQSFIDEAESVLRACAGPDLLAALRNLVVMLPSDHEENDDNARVPAGFVYIRWKDLREARAAIAKATGGAA